MHIVSNHSNVSGRFVLDAGRPGAPGMAVRINGRRPARDGETAPGRALGAGVPTLAIMSGTELSSRLYPEDGAHFLTANRLAHTDDGRVKVSPNTLILTGDAVITARHEAPWAIAAFVTGAWKREPARPPGS